MKQSSFVRRHARVFQASAAAGAVGVSLVLGSGRASAATATTTLAVSATVTTNCTISTSALSFGSYDPIVANASAALDGTGSVSIACTKGTSTTIALNTGSNASGSTRRMAAGTDYLTYELYKDSSRTTVWGSSGENLNSPAAAPSSASRAFTVYGRIAAGQDVPAGSYADTITATVNF